MAKKFSVRYFLNLVLVDEEDRRYFKQQVTDFLLRFMIKRIQEITLWRKAYLNENRIPTNQFISSQLPNGNFVNEKAEQPPVDGDKSALLASEAPEAAF